MATDSQDELTDDALTGGYRVLQRRRGHRYSLDDTVTAWQACRARPDARQVLDLGCGLGSVLLMLAYKLPGARLAGIEAQAESFALAERNVARNRVGDRVRLARGDLRRPEALSTLSGGTRFDLITGTPPYQPPGHGPISPDPQRAHARVELRGGVEDYLAAAAPLLAAGGRAVVCADARRPERVQRGARAAGLHLLSWLRVAPAPHKPPLFGVATLGLPGESAPPGGDEQEHCAREADGSRTEWARELRRFFDLDIDADEAPSPPMRVRGQAARGAGRAGDG